MPLLAIDIEARFARFQDGLDAIQRDVGKAVGGMERSFSQLGRTIGAAFSVGTVFAIFKAAVNDLAALDDAAEQTGSSVEALSAAVNTLRINDAGGLPEILDLTTRLGRAFQNVDKDTSKAAEAFKRLGLNIDDLRGKGRAEAILDIARAQAKFADDAGKAANIDAALGRGAAQLIPQLNELAKTTLDLATANEESAKQGEAAAKQLATLQNQVIALRNDIVTKLLPGFNEMLINLRAFSEIGSAPKDVIASLFGDPEALNKQIADREANVARLRKTQDDLLAQLNALPDSANATPLRRNINTRLASTNQELEAEGLRINQLTALVRRRAALEKQAGVGASVGPEGLRPGLNGSGLGGGDDKKKISDGERLLKQLQDRLFTTLKLTEVQKLESDIARGAIKFDSDRQASAALAAAAQIDSAKEIVELADRESKSAIERISRYEELEATQSRANEQAEKAINDQVQGWEDLANPMLRYQRELERINELQEAGRLSADKAETFRRAQIEGLVGSLDKNKKAAEDVDKAANDLGLTFQSAFEDAVIEGKKLSEVLQGLAKDVARVFLRKTVTEPLAGAASGFFKGLLTPGLGGGDDGSFNPYVGLSTKSVGAASGAVIQNITLSGEVGRGDVSNAMNIATASAKAQILDSMSRRGAAWRAA